MQTWDPRIIFGLTLPELIFYAAGAVCLVSVLIYCMRTEKPLRTALLGMLSGAAALIAVHIFGGRIGLALPLNGVTVFTALTLGVPGVAAMCIINYFA